jgi:hypothetical protein
LQRKPANRLGLRGALEVKEHEWLKYYPWKELYDKTLESPFIPKDGDNFDSRYCNKMEVLGNETKAKYDSYLRNDALKTSFKCFTYIYKEETQDIHNFNNPHNNIINISDICSIDMNRGMNLNMSIISKCTSSNNSVQHRIRVDPSILIENKFIKIKNQSNSASTSSLLRQYSTKQLY